MKYDIIIAGVGGQGILSIATVLGRAVVNQGLNLKQPEVHGMAQRGGAVQSHFRFSDRAVASDVIPTGGADLIVSMEPMEALRYVNRLSPKGWIVSNSEPVENISDYPDMKQVMDAFGHIPNHFVFDGTELARAAGSLRSLNMAMLGAASAFIPLPAEALEQAIREQFAGKKDSLIDTNIQVFREARQQAQVRAASA